MTTRPGRHRIQSPAQGRNPERVQPGISRPDIDRNDRRSENGFTRRRFLTGAGMVGAAAFSGQLLTSQVANAAPDRRRLVDALMPVAPQPVSKTLVGFAANGREADFSHLQGLGLPVQCARVYNPPGKRPLTLPAAHLQLVKDLNIPAVIVSYKPDCAEARKGAWDTWAAQCAMMMKQLTGSG